MRTGEVLKHSPLAMLLLFSLLAFWPVLDWYAQRILSPDGEYWSLLALIAAITLILKSSPARIVNRINLYPASILLFIYCLTFWFVPPLFRAMFALLAIGSILGANREWRSIPLAVWGLLLLALPVVASLQFYLGYPIRVTAGEISVFLLQLNGLAVVREGVVMNWADTLVSIDAPCSGIKMLWTGLFLSLVLAGMYRLKYLHTVYLLVMTLLIVITGNALRVTSLFYVETSIVPSMHWAHDSIGILTFMFITILVSWQAIKLSSRRGASTPAAII